eukprot:TRINITY_DN2413_c0_g1_i2.p1 TRINITY_DN2413_c0_g1~~TRINITY_DN2413_c0_g1_i2.p1  ORF type:complete len:1029 (-),score=200.68 TRINITY_DN2413_c0_g1_i2:5-3091(-)
MVSTIVESLFQKSLEDLVKGLRSQVIGESRYLSKAMEEIQKEIKSTDHQTKAVALEKLTYLNMLQGFDMSWAAFHVVEVVSMPRFCHKKIGYLAASQSFKEDTEVLLLMTNQLRKDLTSTNEHEVSLALECLSRIASPDLARDLTPEIFTLLSSSKALLRKKATAVLLRIFEKSPDAVKVAFKRLVGNMEDSDHQISCAAVSVFCELATKDPKTYLPLAPEFYRILTSSTNNWMLIKVVKIFGVLIPLEPRLGKKVADPLCQLMLKTVAKSLLLECIRTVISVLTNYERAVRLAAEQLKALLRESDPNLKYLGLQAVAALMQSHPWVVTENKEVIIKALSDPDLSIQKASLRLVSNMINGDNIIDIVGVLMRYSRISSPDFSNEILGSILLICCNNLYEFVDDFDWYVALLGDIGRIPYCNHGKEIERQLIDIGIRVKDARPMLMRVSRRLLIDPALLELSSVHVVLSAAAWIAGEYVEYSRNSFEIIEALLQPRTNFLPPSVRAVYLQSLMKVFVFCYYSHLKTRMPNSSQDHKLGMLESENLLFGSDFEGELVSDVKSKKASHIMSGLSCMKGKTGSGSSNEDTLAAKSSESTSVVENVELNTNLSKEEPISELRTAPPSIAEAEVNVDGETCSISDNESHLSDNSGREGGKNSSLVQMIELIKINVGPLCGSQHVEVQERACNILGLVKALEEFSGGVIPKERDDKMHESPVVENPKVDEIISFMHGIFSEDFGPVSLHAQGKVQVPEGLALKDNLNELVEILHDERLKLEVGQQEVIFQTREWEGVSLFTQPKDESMPEVEQTSLLAAHRQRHGVFYLSTDKGETKTNDHSSVQQDVSSANSDSNKDILKLAEQSLFSKKSRKKKSRPLVVRSEDASEAAMLAANEANESQESLITTAVKEAFFDYESKHLLGRDRSKDPGSSSWPSHRLSHYAENIDGAESTKKEKHKTRKHRHSKKHEKGASLSSVSSKLDPKLDDVNIGSSESRRRGKLKEENQSHAKQRQRADSPLKVVPQTPIIPDFLL